jgi:hypothetical protein
MKRLLIFSFLILSSVAISAQDEFSHYAYCELKLLPANAGVQVVFQSGIGFDKELSDAQGKPLVFKSLTEALNSLSRIKWILVQTYQLPDGPRFILRKEIRIVKPIS